MKYLHIVFGIAFVIELLGVALFNVHWFKAVSIFVALCLLVCLCLYLYKLNHTLKRVEFLSKLEVGQLIRVQLHTSVPVLDIVEEVDFKELTVTLRWHGIVPFSKIKVG